jgi:putative endonuclease
MNLSTEQYYCYILSNKNRTVLYIGYTDNLNRRISQHKNGNGALFTKKYNAFDLVYFQIYSTKKEAKKREKQLKNWRRDWKWDLIRKFNPNLKTLEI